MSKGLDQLAGIISSFKKQDSDSIANVKGEYNLKIAKEFYEISVKDLEASRILYEKKLYSASIYYLQQSAEKMGKSYFLAIGQTSVENIYSHNAFTSIVREIYNKNKELFDMTEHAKGISFDVIPSLKKMKIESEKIRTITNEKIVSLFDELHKEESQFDDDERIKNQIESWISYHKENIPELTEKKAEEIKVQLFSNLDPIKLYLKKNVLAYRIVILNILMFPHITSTRYPLRRENGKMIFDNFFSYDESMGVIQSYPKIAGELNSLLSQLSQLFSSKEQ